MISKMKLSIRAGYKPGFEQEYETDHLTIGRDPENLMVIDDIEVSRYHAIINHNEDGFFIEDLNSTNSTFLNGRKINKSEKIENGDLITLGESVVLAFSYATEELYSGEEIRREPLGLEFSEEGFLPEDFPGKVIEKPKAEDIRKVQQKQSVLEKFPSWVVILIIALAFLVIFCFIPFIVIELTNQWCNLFSGFFNVISPGVCP